ncbi:MAG: manganese efflux pump MntP family protein [Planctomycetota bacterium]
MITLLMLGGLIGANNLGAALALGAMGQVARRRRIVLVFAVFEFAMPLVGIVLGQTLTKTFGGAVVWVSPAVLIWLGLWSVFKAICRPRDQAKLAEKLTTWRGLVLLELGLSSDNLGVGFSLGLTSEINPFALASVIAVFSASYGYFGLRIGDRARRHWEQYAQIGAGVVLIGLAAAMVIGWL